MYNQVTARALLRPATHSFPFWPNGRAPATLPPLGRLLIFALLIPVMGQAGMNAWHTEEQHRWSELAVPAQGKTGFTLVPSEQTGVNFTNWLDDHSSAANRVLENGSGVAIGDFDQDGRPDIFLCSLQGRNALYHNLGSWKFEEVSEHAGVTTGNMACRGAVFADLDGDGWPDLLISTLGRGVLCFVNDGRGHFRDETPPAGTSSTLGSMTMALADIDGNGTLDLYVANYRAEDMRDRSRIDVQRVNGQVVLAPHLRDRLILTGNGLLEFGESDILYLGDGHGRFQPVSWTDGRFEDEDGQPLANPPRDWGLSATFRDMNGDGLPDLYVCNDYWTPDRAWINTGHGRFRAIPRLALRHYSENSMGVDFADIDRDGQVDFLVLDMLSRDPALRKRQALAQTRLLSAVGSVANRPQIMRNTLFHNRGDGTFEEIAEFAGLAASDWSWQPIFVDVDLDGYEDLIIPAGHRRDIQDLDATARIRSLQHPWPRGMDPKTHQEAFTRQMMEHGRLYPPLDLPILAFRNRGDLHFEETTDAWGTSAPGVHQGVACADLDGDGDLDFVVNNLNGSCGLYRNESTAGRVAVRLRGRTPNTAGIGAQVTLEGGAVPRQSQEVVCGGRYLSSSEPLLVFATGSSPSKLALHVRWRSGHSTLIGDVRPNRIYEISETPVTVDQSSLSPASAAHAPSSGPTQAALFADASERLRHAHVENEFDDFGRQPLLPRKLSQLGPGVACFDLNGDGHQDLVIGTGQGGIMAVAHGDGRGGFRLSTNAPPPVRARDQTGLVALRDDRGQSLVLAGSANYEDGLAAGPSVLEFDADGRQLKDAFPGDPASVGALALADLRGDGRLALFVGGRVIPGRYPEPASSRVFHRKDGKWQLDPANTRVLEKVGLVTGAVWSDLTGDGLPELVLACEWGPIRVFANQAGQLLEITRECRLEAQTGLWSGVTTGDVNGDGKLDIIAGNWGWNSPDRATTQRPLLLCYGDFTQRGTVDLIETDYDSKRQAWVPRHRLDFLMTSLPFLQEPFPTFKAFSEATLDQVLGSIRARSALLRVETLASTVFLNQNGRFVPMPLPREAQFAPASSVTVADFNGDGREDLFLSQNFFPTPWESVRQDAGRGLLLLGEGNGTFRPTSGQFSGIAIYGDQRGAATADFNEDGRPDLVVTQNGSDTKLYLNQSGRAGLRVRLRGPAGNPDGLGAVLQLGFGDAWGPVREIHAGSGYWSQDSPVQVLASPNSTATALKIRWPGGMVTTHKIPPHGSDIVVSWVEGVTLPK